MPTLSPNRKIKLYDSTTDTQTKFLSYRTDVNGNNAASGMMILDKWSGEVDKSITELKNRQTSILINANLVSTGYYEAIEPKVTSYQEHMIITFRPTVDNDGTTTLKINNLDVKTLMKYENDGSVKNLDPRDLRINHEYQFRYDGTRWVWQGGSSADQTNIVGDADNLICIDANNNLVDSGVDKTQVTTNTNDIMQIKTDKADKQYVDTQDTLLDGKITENTNKIGDLSTLTTTQKGSLVGAINEIDGRMIGIGGSGKAINSIESITSSGFYTGVNVIGCPVQGAITIIADKFDGNFYTLYVRDNSINGSFTIGTKNTGGWYWQTIATTNKTETLLPYDTGYKTIDASSMISKYSKINNICYLSLAIQKTDGTPLVSQFNPCTIPIGYRPETSIVLNGYFESSSSRTGTGVVWVGSNGSCTVYLTGGTVSNFFKAYGSYILA